MSQFGSAAIKRLMDLLITLHENCGKTKGKKNVIFFIYFGAASEGAVRSLLIDHHRFLSVGFRLSWGSRESLR
jgi:hypothetical protein